MDAAYKPLLSASSPSRDLEKDYQQDDESDGATIGARTITKERAVLVLSLLVNLLFFISTVHPFLGSESTSPADDPIWGVREPLFSPAQSAVKYERRVFGYLGAKTIYHGPPTNETDKAWNDLYPVGLTRITKAEADLIPNRTEPIPGDENHYLVALDVFHQLHCLNTIRRALSPDRYGRPVKGSVPDSDAFDHVDHCVNSIRESLMCSADITPNVWQWDEKQQISFPRLNNVHTCRRWDVITAWAAERKLLEKFNNKIHVLPNQD